MPYSTSKESTFDGETTLRHTSLCSGSQCPPWGSQNPGRITWVSDQQKIILCKCNSAYRRQHSLQSLTIQPIKKNRIILLDQISPSALSIRDLGTKLLILKVFIETVLLKRAFRPIETQKKQSSFSPQYKRFNIRILNFSIFAVQKRLLHKPQRSGS